MPSTTTNPRPNSLLSLLLLLTTTTTLLLLPQPVSAAECFPELRTGVFSSYVDAGIWAVRVTLCNADRSNLCIDKPGSYCEISGEVDRNGVFAKGWRRGGYSQGTPFPFCLNATREIIEGCWKSPTRRMGAAWTDGPERYEMALFHINDTRPFNATGDYVMDSYQPTTFITASTKPTTGTTLSTATTATTTTGASTTSTDPSNPTDPSGTNSNGGGANNTSPPVPPLNVTTNNGMSAGTTAGIAVGVTLGVLVILGAAFLLYRRRAEAKQQRDKERQARDEATRFITATGSPSVGGSGSGAHIGGAAMGGAAGGGGGGYYSDNLSKTGFGDVQGVPIGGYIGKDPVEVSSIRPAGELPVNEFVGGELYGSPALVEMEGDHVAKAGLVAGVAGAAATPQGSLRRKEVPGMQATNPAGPPPMYMHQATGSTAAVPGGSVDRQPSEGEGGHWNRV